MVMMRIKKSIRAILPPSFVIHLIAMKNYRNGEPELRILKSLVDPNKNSLDIGANKGVYTYFLSRLSRQVFAYEPNPELAKFLTQSVSSNVTVQTIALSNSEGQATLSIPIVDSFLYDQLGTLSNNIGVSPGKTYTVPLKPLDHQGHTNVGFIKIDVEGHEEAVIDGAVALLKQQRPTIMVEIEQRHHPDKNIDEIFTKILSLGYEGFFLINGELKTLNDFSLEKYQDTNNYHGHASLGKTYISNFIFKPLAL
ncbi:methyltransferase FkbM family protein [Calothrix sp. NIES-4101]|nr:methyltransferase FkbM family protein [Calothrix sp. NIES-4101]